MYVLGIDSGGTHYRVLAVDENGQKLGEYSGGTCSHYYFPREEMVRGINENIDRCLETFGGRREDCRYIVCGTTGLDSKEDEAILIEAYESLAGFSCPVYCINDAELAHHTVTGGVGALVISGTGSIAFGRSSDGRSARTGGWLFSIMGEEGSGSWVSRMALRHLGNCLDGAAERGPLAELVSAETNVHTHKELMDLAVAIGTPPWREPKLGALVDKAADAGDPYAAEIITKAAHEIFKLAETIVTMLQLDAEPDFKIGIWGSNIVNSRRHREIFTGLIGQRFPRAAVILPSKSAAQGAAELALDRLKKNG
ncbi:N-acetylglucosamine kinase [Breznakiella homolactica]|uniref:ATPase BadF/BadG/BcrA/BcrD type domain-containing protein n=1 Tax=Breznakiella homolactica TaxID=2798577 RepID=A0A7T7XLM2_9SPIR|nr:BadF/BadG/BcrA/BcrD ATPase family protein [Breznakiella homolactica]QQO08482.1 hypothetical protein JFL75_16315 [Breznakiella homolactica]